MIEIITTGGTIDKTYNPISGNLEFNTSHIPEILKNSNLTIEYKFKHLLQKDSLEMTQDDRELIYNYCNKSNCRNILITHGTDTMTLTANELTKITNKKIILTGAMIPYSIKNSDAIFNLGFALASLNYLANGIYIAINGKIFDAQNVKKNLTLGIFE